MTPARTASSATPRARRSASAASWAAPRRRSPRPRPRSCSRRPTSRPWRSPARPSASACAPRRRRASSAAATPGGSSRRCGASASCWPRASPGSRVADGMLDVRGEVPEPFVVSVPDRPGAAPDRGRRSGARRSHACIEPIGFTVLEHDAAATSGSRSWCRRTGPTCGREPYGVDDVIEEIARTFGYSNVPRHVPTWPQPGRLTSLQRSRRAIKDVLVGLGASEGWTDTFVSAAGARRRRPDGPGGAGGQPARRREAVPPALAHARAARRAGLQRQPAPARRSASSRWASSSRTPTRARPGSSSAPVRVAPRRAVLPGERELLSARLRPRGRRRPRRGGRRGT